MIKIVTGSPRKQQEITKYINGRIQFEFIAQDLNEIQGTATEVLVQKLKDAHALVGGPVVVEDFSLYIDALCGFPGPYVKSILSSGGLGQIVKNLQPLGATSCEAESLFAYMDEAGEVHTFSSKVKGTLVPLDEPADGLFGIDKSMIQAGTTIPFFHLSEEEKDARSIRRETIDKLVSHISQ
ncbi:inosine triphosphate pyrophosphatase [Nematocida displodere]|uniref:Inosine triphosphate pyrophosphatase n=1 Tax=Nematocida displodere TaxID=1805483 RepID=A0A177ELZ8_9MICR|nr:inosine triphosphate pyrophosphatase [Nematocida displodere]